VLYPTELQAQNVEEPDFEVESTQSEPLIFQSNPHSIHEHSAHI